MEQDEKQIYDEIIVEKYKQKIAKIAQEKQQDYLYPNLQQFQAELTDNSQLFNDYLSLATEQFEQSLAVNNDKFLAYATAYADSNEAIFDLNRKAKQLQSQNIAVYNATIGSLYNEDGSLFTFDSFYKAYEQISQQDKSRYCEAIEGSELFLDSLYQHINQNNNLKLCHRQIATAGGTGALSIAFSLFLNPNQSILLPQTGWSNYTVMAENYHLKPVYYALTDNDNKIDLTDLMLKSLQIIKKQHKLVVVINDPCQNPTGISIGENNWKILIAYFNRLKEYGNVVIINDIAYIDYAYNNPYGYLTHFNSMQDNLLSIIAYSCSKAVSGYGYRVGMALIAASDEKEVNRVFNCFKRKTRCLYSNVNNGFMLAYGKMMTEYRQEYQAELSLAVSLLKKRSEAFIKEAGNNNLPIYPYKEGFFITVKVEDVAKLTKLNEKLIENNVFAVKVNRGIRFSICSLTIEQCQKLPTLISSLYKEVNND
ncbi:MAG: pyridoxal phosphate-dependent aminotransferase [Erysipelotrichaceae bacterium]